MSGKYPPYSPRRHCKVGRAANQSIPDGGAGAIIAWDKVYFDPSGLFDPALPGAFVVPAGAAWIEVVASVEWQSSALGTRRMIEVTESGVIIFGGMRDVRPPLNIAPPLISSLPGVPVPCTPGQVFGVTAWQDAGIPQAVTASDWHTWVYVAFWSECPG